VNKNVKLKNANIDTTWYQAVRTWDWLITKPLVVGNCHKIRAAE